VIEGEGTSQIFELDATHWQISSLPMPEMFMQRC